MSSDAPPVPVCVKVPCMDTVVPKFQILDQVLDLTEFQDMDNLVVNDAEEGIKTIFEKYVARDEEALLEVHSGKWYSETYHHLVVNPCKDWLFPLILYIDKTGTDAMQWFPLEPLMFTTSVLRRQIRERSSAWRHLGFVPPYDESGASPEKTLQAFHACLEVLLCDLLALQRSPPLVEFTFRGTKVRKRLLLPVAFIIGDQQSQDKHCGRKPINAGGAGRIHRRCMCSSMAVSKGGCQMVSKTDIDALLQVCHQQDVAVEGFKSSSRKG
jgi:hypothetical protein